MHINHDFATLNHSVTMEFVVKLNINSNPFAKNKIMVNGEAFEQQKWTAVCKCFVFFSH